MIVHQWYIEEFIKPNNDIALSTKFIDNICKIINFRDDVIIGLITNVIDTGIVFKIKTSVNDEVIFYPKEMIKDIRVLKGMNV